MADDLGLARFLWAEEPVPESRDQQDADDGDDQFYFVHLGSPPAVPSVAVANSGIAHLSYGRRKFSSDSSAELHS